MYRRILLLSSIVVLSFSAATSQQKTNTATATKTPVAADKKIPTDPNLRIGKLPNGITYYIRKNVEPKNRAELRLVVKAGSILETDKQAGLAHFTEHMSFNGTK